jgi:predicted nucleic acid-binding Zn ribbon protein
MEHGRSELQKIFAQALKNASADEGPLLAWPLVCGGSVAKRTRVLGFRAGVLQVQVPDRQWRTELEALAADYIRELNTLLKKKVSRVEFVVPGERSTTAEKKASKKK